MASTSIIDDLMNFDSNDVTAMFQEPASTKSGGNPNLYKTNPTKVTKENAPDGHYHSRIRVLYNPFNKDKSIVNTAHYAFNDADGFFMVDSKLALGDKSCPIFKAWKQLHFSQDTTPITVDGKTYTKKEWGDHMYDKGEEQFVLVQILEDVNQPELVGKFMVMALKKAIFKKLNAKMAPTDPSKVAVDLMNPIFGPVLEMDVTPGPDDPKAPERKQREISYDLCEFEGDPSPIIKVDGTALFTDEELDKINDYAEGKKILAMPKSTKSKKEAALKSCKELVEPLKELMARALDYMQENALNLEEEVGYKEPTKEQWDRVNRWIDIVNNKLQNPVTYVEPTIAAEQKAAAPVEDAGAFETGNAEDDLPF